MGSSLAAAGAGLISVEKLEQGTRKIAAFKFTQNGRIQIDQFDIERSNGHILKQKYLYSFCPLISQMVEVTLKGQ